MIDFMGTGMLKSSPHNVTVWADLLYTHKKKLG